MSEIADTELRIAIPYDARSFNEVWKNYTGHGGYFAANNIYSRLVVLDVFDTGDIHPDLAETWDILDNGQRYIFHLNKNARWHDGEPLTAHDVVYTYEEVKRCGYQGLSWIKEIETIRAIDDHTVECILDGPNAAFLAQLGSFVFSHIVPKHLYEGTDWDTNPHNWDPVGSGPFKFIRHIEGDRIELEANTEYWGDGPYVSRLTYIVIPDDEEAHQALWRGDVHHTVHGVNAADLDDWADIENVAVRVDSGNSIGWIAFNWRQERFQDRRVREAFARALDRQGVADAIYKDLDTPVNYYLDHVSWAFNPDAVAPELDLELAGELLDQAGFERGDDGSRMEIRIAARSLYPHYAIAANVMQSQLAAVGVDVTVEVLDPFEWQERVATNHDFDIAIDAGDIGPDPHQFASFIASDGPRNIQGYGNDVVDDCFRKGRSTIDRQERGQYYKQLQAALAADIARVPFLRYGEYLPYRTEFDGFSWSAGVRGTVPVWYMGKVRRVR